MTLPRRCCDDEEPSPNRRCIWSALGAWDDPLPTLMAGAEAQSSQAWPASLPVLARGSRPACWVVVPSFVSCRPDADTSDTIIGGEECS